MGGGFWRPIPAELSWDIDNLTAEAGRRPFMPEALRCCCASTSRRWSSFSLVRSVWRTPSLLDELKSWGTKVMFLGDHGGKEARWDGSARRRCGDLPSGLEAGATAACSWTEDGNDASRTFALLPQMHSA